MHLTPLGANYFATSAFAGRGTPTPVITACGFLALFTNTVEDVQAGAAPAETSGTGYARIAVTWTAPGTGDAFQPVPRTRYVVGAPSWTAGAGGFSSGTTTIKAIGLCLAVTGGVNDVHWMANLATPLLMPSGTTLAYQAQKIWAELGPMRSGSMVRIWGKWYAYAMMQAHLNALDKLAAQFANVVAWTGTGPLRALALHLGSGTTQLTDLDVATYAQKGLNEFTELSGLGYVKGIVPGQPTAGPQQLTMAISGSYPYYAYNTNEVVFPTAAGGDWNPAFAVVMNWYLASGSSWGSAVAQEIIAAIPLLASDGTSIWKTTSGNTLTIPVGNLKIYVK